MFVSIYCSTVMLQPLDLVKTRLQQNLAGSMVATAVHVLRTERVSGLWRGIAPSITRTVPGVGLYFGSLHWLKTRVVGPGREDISALQSVLMGMAARTFAGCAMIPITVIKTRYESRVYEYSRMSTALAQIYSREGVRGLCCGLVPTLVRDAPFSGLYLMFYTQLKQRFSVDTAHCRTAAEATASHFVCGVLAGVLASFVTHPADVIKTKMQLYPKVCDLLPRHPSSQTTRIFCLPLQEYGSVRGTVGMIWSGPVGPRGFLVGLAPRMLRRTLVGLSFLAPSRRVLCRV